MNCFRFISLLTLVAAALSCSSDDAEPPLDPPVDPPVDPGLEPICTAGTRWAPGTAAFREVTAEWGLKGVTGTRISTVDYDGDGYSDLIVRHANDKPGGLGDRPDCCLDASCVDGEHCQARRIFLMRNNGNRGFEDATISSGFAANRTETDATLGRPGQTVAFGDVDNDGDLDVYTGRTDSTTLIQTETSELLINNGDGTFSLGPVENPFRLGQRDSPGGASFVDYDRNGVLDLWVAEGSYGSTPLSDRLYWGDGTGLFTDVSSGVGISSKSWSNIDDLNNAEAHTNGWSALACDLNNDGNPELLASSYGRSPNKLWQATGPDGAWQYVNRSIDSGYAFDHRVDWTDNESARCHCKLNPSAQDCAGVPAPMFIGCNTQADAFRWNHATDRNAFRLGGNSGSSICADINNDGNMDLLTTEIVHWDVGSSSDPSELLFNTGEADVRFERPGNEVTGLAVQHEIVSWNDGDISGAVFDFDNDGWPDVYIGRSEYPGAKGLLFHQTAPGAFVAVPFVDGINQNRSHGIAVADFDRDGDLDVIVGHSSSRCPSLGRFSDCYPTKQVRMFENITGQDGNWLQIRLSGPDPASGLAGSNRSAVGARVTVTDENGVSQTQEVGGGHGHYGAQHDLALHFGLGTACRADVTVRWPDGALTTETAELVAGYRFEWTQFEEPTAILKEEN
jgi:hypothetical protein